MQSRIIFENGGQKTFVVVLKTGEEVLSCLKEFVKAERIFAAQFTAIGALSDVVLKYYNWEKKEYEGNQIHEQVEVASLLGDVAEGPAGEPAIHAHLVVGKRDGSAMAGHLGEAHVRPTRGDYYRKSGSSAQVRGS